MFNATRPTRPRMPTGWPWDSCSDAGRRAPLARSADPGPSRDRGPRRGLSGAGGVCGRSIRIDARAQGPLAHQGRSGAGGGNPGPSADAAAAALLERGQQERVDPRGDREGGADHGGVRRRGRPHRSRARARLSREPRAGSPSVVVPEAVQGGEAGVGQSLGSRHRWHRRRDALGERHGAHGEARALFRPAQSRQHARITPVSPKLIFLLFLRRWHARIGFVAVIFFLFLAVTGFVLNHTKDLRLDAQYVHSAWLARWYGIAPERPREAFHSGR